MEMLNNILDTPVQENTLDAFQRDFNRYDDSIDEEHQGFNFDVSPNQEGETSIQLCGIPEYISEDKLEKEDNEDNTSLLAAPGSEIDDESQDGSSRQRKLSDVEDSLNDIANEEKKKILLPRQFSVRINGNEVFIYTKQGSCVMVTVTGDDEEKESLTVNVFPSDNGKKTTDDDGTLKRTRDKDTESSVCKKQKTGTPLTDEDFIVPRKKSLDDLTGISSEPPLMLFSEDEDKKASEDLTKQFLKPAGYRKIPRKPTPPTGTSEDPYCGPPMTPMSAKIWDEISRTPVRTFSMDLKSNAWK